MNFSHIKCAIVAGIIASTASCSQGDEPNITPTNVGDPMVAQSQLMWAACPEREELDCATVMVPMNYADPSGESITLGLVRHAADPAVRQGALLINPGGPGDSGSQLIKLLDYSENGTFPARLIREFDIVGFDPRGLGESTPIDCQIDGELAGDLYPTMSADFAALIELRTAEAQRCIDQYGGYLQHLGSNNVVRDMDEIRKLLGEPSLNFIGISYGTRLAALYLQQFPSQSGRFVLDAAVSPTPSIENSLEYYLQIAQVTLDTILERCVSIDESCDPAALATALQDRVTSLSDQAPTVANQTELFMVFSVLQLATENPGFEDLAIGVLYPYITTGDTSEIESALDMLVPDEVTADSTNFSLNRAVNCADDEYRPTVASLTQLLNDFNVRSDFFAEQIIPAVAMCAGWPEAKDPVPVVATDIAPASLVIGGKFDSDTPFVLSEQMADAIGGKLLTSEHEGHTIVFSGESSCVDRAVAGFLLDGLFPSNETCTEE